MDINIHNVCTDYNSYRAARVKSLFNVSSGADFRLAASLPIENDKWKLGVVVGPSGSGKSSLGAKIFPGVSIHDSLAGWSPDKPIVDDIAPDGSFDEVTGSLAAVGLGSVPSWLRPFHVLSNGEKFRADLARLLCTPAPKVIIDEFTSVVDRQIAKIGAGAFSKAWKRQTGRQCIVLSCHYDILEWLEPDWVFDTATGTFDRRLLRRPKIEVEIWKVNSRFWPMFEPHYYLKLPKMVAAEYFIGTVDGVPVCHLGVGPNFQTHAYRASRMVVLPEWQGAGVGMRFLNAVCQLHLEGAGRQGRLYPTLFHTSHPGLVAALKRDKKWKQLSAMTHGVNKAKSEKSIVKSGCSAKAGFGGHFRAVQGFKYLGEPSA